ncbi:MAG: hypothetical protein GXP54_12105 [Deltaproteobacteria bacterium]|nr:hypothetical protein [Deltaproteobacteria bacterium]
MRARPLGLMCMSALVAGMLSFLSGPAQSRNTPPNKDVPSFPRRTVMVLQGRDYRLDPEGLFWTGDKKQDQDGAGNDLGKAAAGFLSSEPELEVLRPQAGPPSDEAGEERGIVARGFLHLGSELYRNFRLNDAVKALEKGVEAARSEFLDVTDPDLLSDLYLFLGLSYLEAGSAALAHVSFKNMFFVTPGRRFMKGYFPDEAEIAIHAAAVDFRKTFPIGRPLGSAARATRFARKSGARQLVYVFLSRGGEGDVVGVRVLGPSGPHRSFIPEFSTDFSYKNASQAKELVSRAMSAWLACAKLPSRVEPKHRLPSFYMDTSGSYSVFLKYPTRNVFHNVGFGIGLSYQILENLDFFTRLNLFTSFPDKYDDLVVGYTAFKGTLGVGYTLRGDWGRMFLHTGFDLQYLSDFASSTSPNCKFFGVDSEFCASADVKGLPYRFLGGINVTIGANVTISGPIYLLVQAGITAYFFPAGLDAPLNYPFTAEIGLGYAFQ